jgi:hypothetical protein
MEGKIAVEELLYILETVGVCWEMETKHGENHLSAGWQDHNPRTK